MTLQDIGSIGELVGAIATVATLVYLAVQVRQNSKQMADSARLARFGFTDRTVEAFSRYRGLMAQPQNAEIYVRGLESYTELNQADRIIFRALMEEYFFAFTRIFEQMGLGFAYPNWTAQARAAAAILKTPGGQRGGTTAKSFSTRRLSLKWSASLKSNRSPSTSLRLTRHD